MTQILIAEDEPRIASFLEKGLRANGYATTVAADGPTALALARDDDFDLLILDLGLPGLDGIDVARELHRRSPVPIIMLTARGDEIDRVVGLEIGADDYLVKPFGFRELVARMRAVMRRAGRFSSTTTGSQRDALTLGPLVVDPRTRRVSLDGREIALTPKEFDVLAVLMEDPGGAVRREEILRRVWDENWYGPTKTLDVHVASVRKKLGDSSWIETVRGVGFRVVDPR